MSGLPNLLLACLFFYLGDAVDPAYTLWGWFNLIIGCTFILSDAIIRGR